MGSIRLFSLVLLLIFFSCNDNSTKNSTDPATSVSDSSGVAMQNQKSIQGTWELTSYYHYTDNVVSDTFGVRNGFRQIKMYTPTKIMWSRQVPKDSLQWFGYGHYKVVDGQLIENLEFGSEMMSEMIKDNAEFRFELILGDNNFSQIEIDDEGNRLFSENYKRIE
ncbi:hypothetical protein [Aegicerativicinus sediminis]